MDNAKGVICCYAMSKGKAPEQKRSEVLQGTLDLMILKTLDAMGPLHGYGIARRIEQLSEDVLQLNEGTVYTSLLRLQQLGPRRVRVSGARAFSVSRKARRRRQAASLPGPDSPSASRKHVRSTGFRRFSGRQSIFRKKQRKD